MLVLTRKKNQGIILGNDIKIVVLEVKDDTVKLGIDAPREVSILREELYRAVREENACVVLNDEKAAELLKNLLK